jgi:hypothetical protein
MHLSGVWLAAYYNWWLARVETRPGLWEIGLCSGQVLLFSAASFVFPVFIVVIIWVLSGVVAGPGVLAASQIRKRRSDQADSQRQQLRKTQKLIERGNVTHKK